MAALEAFNRSGYDATGIAEIAATTGMTKAAVGYHFPARSDLLQTLVDPLLDALEVVLQAHDGEGHGGGTAFLCSRTTSGCW